MTPEDNPADDVQITKEWQAGEIARLEEEIRGATALLGIYEGNLTERCLTAPQASASEPLCVWCGKPKAEHTVEATAGGYTGKLCPVPGVSSQFWTPPKASVVEDTAFIEKLVQQVHDEEAELSMLRKFRDEVGAAIANEDAGSIEHLIATAMLGKHTHLIGVKRYDQLRQAETENSALREEIVRLKREERPWPTEPNLGSEHACDSKPVSRHTIAIAGELVRIGNRLAREAAGRLRDLNTETERLKRELAEANANFGLVSKARGYWKQRAEKAEAELTAFRKLAEAYPSIWLRRDGDDAVVSINVEGREVELIREPCDSPFSHCIHDGGIKREIAKDAALAATKGTP